MSRPLELLISLGVPLLLLTGLTSWLRNRRHHLPPVLAWLEERSGTIWVSGIVLMVTLSVLRVLLAGR